MDIDDGEIESASAGAEERIREQEPWLRRLPMDFETILDIGAGVGCHSKWFFDRGKKPTALDRYGNAFRYGQTIEFIQSDLNGLEKTRRFDAIFCSHILEHFPDPASSVLSMRDRIKDGGYLFVIVPPYVPVSVNYHWHTGWNCTQLALFLVGLGFDCSSAQFVQLGMNICGWGKKADVAPTRFNLRRSLPLLPKAMRDRFFQRDEQDFLPGNIVLAEGGTCRFSPVEQRFTLSGFKAKNGRDLVFPDAGWQSFDLTYTERDGLDLMDKPIELAVMLEGAMPILRIALGSGSQDPWSDCAERYLGDLGNISCFSFTVGDFKILRGEPNFKNIRCISIGGFGPPSGLPANVRIWFGAAALES